MKKFGAILLTFCMLMSLCAAPVFADDITLTISALSDVREGGPGVGFYDNSIANRDNSYKLEEFYGDKLVLRSSGEWTTYDISFDETTRPAGTYEIDMTYVSTASGRNVVLDFIVDDALAVSTRLKGNASAWTEDSEASGVVGKIYLDENASVLKVKNNSGFTVYLETITLKYVGAEDTTVPYVLYTENISNRVNETRSGTAIVDGEDYHDATDLNNHFSGSTLVHHNTEWSRYDVSDFKPGTYNVTAYMGTTANSTTAISIDGVSSISKTVPSSGGYTKYATVELGKLFIGRDSKYLTLKTTGGSAYIQYLTFTYVADTAAYTINPQQAIDYYDNATAGGSRGLEKVGSGIYLRNSEWASYDVSKIVPGVYKFKFEYNVRKTDPDAFVKVSFDGAIKKTIHLDNLSAALDSEPVVSAGENIEIKPGTKVLKIANTTRAVLNLYSITLWDTDEPENSIVRIYGGNISQPSGSPVKGTDYYDVAGGSVQASEATVHHAGDWSRYDVANIPAGVYKVTAAFGTTSAGGKASVSVDEGLSVNVTLPNYSSYFAYVPNVFTGYLTFDGNQEYIKLENTGAYAYYAQYIDLERISDEVKYVYGAASVIPGGHGVGFYDAGGKDTLEGNGVVGGSVARTGDWYKYDLSLLPAGTYDVVVHTAAKAAPKFAGYINDSETAVFNTAIKNTASYFVYADITLGKITVDDSTSTLKIVSAGVAYYDTISFVPVVPVIDVTKVTYSSDAAGNKKVDSLYGLSKAYVKVEIARPQETALDMYICVAVYEGHTYKKLKYILQPEEAITTNTYSQVFTLTGLAYDDVVKTFIWDGKTYEPLSGIHEISVK